LIGCFNWFPHTIKETFVMLRNEASSSPFVAALVIEEDPSLSFRMTKVYFIVIPSKFSPPFHREKPPAYR